MALTGCLVFALCMWQVCDGAPTHPSPTIRQILEKLHNLTYKGNGGCEPLAKHISFPRQIPAVNLTFELASDLFNASTWESRHSSTLADLSALLARGASEAKGSIPDDKLTELRTYFKELGDLLSGQNFSVCAREEVRSEIRKLFFRLRHHQKRQHSGR